MAPAVVEEVNEDAEEAKAEEGSSEWLRCLFMIAAQSSKANFHEFGRRDASHSLADS
jgi:hypothetical protein